MIWTLLTASFLLLAVPLGALVAVPWTLVSGDIRFLYALAMRIARTAVRLGGIRVKIEGLENLDPKRAYFFMSNHVSNVDPPIVVPALPMRTSILVKKELFRVPILGTVMRLGSLVPVDRSDRESAIASLDYGKVVMGQGIAMTAFPEGTRSTDGKLQPFKKGTFYLAMDAGVPVVPTTILGTFAIMPKGRWKIRPGVATVVFHKPILPVEIGDRERLMEAVRTGIAQSLPVEMQD